MIKSTISQMKKYAGESDKELNEDATVQALEFQGGKFLNTYLNQFPASVCKTRVLLDGGASHNVYYSSEIPEGAVKKRVELAHGTKFGHVKGEDSTFLVKNAPEKSQTDLQSSVWIVWFSMG